MNTALADIEVESTLRAQAENILNKIGLSYSQAINLFTKQVILKRGFPIKLDLPVKKPVCINDLAEEEIDAMIKEASDSIDAGRYYTHEEMKERLAERYGIKF